MRKLSEAIQDWMTPEGAVTVNSNKTEDDNAILHTAVYSAVVEKKTGYALLSAKMISIFRMIDFGVFARRPCDTFPSQHDDHIGAASVSPAFANAIAHKGRWSLWYWGWGYCSQLRHTMDRQDALKEMIGYYFNWQLFFKPGVLIMAKRACSLIQQAKFAIAFWLNGRKGPVSDNSRLRLWLVQEKCYGKGYKLVDKSIEYWRMQVGNPKRIFDDYFPSGHALSEFAPTEW